MEVFMVLKKFESLIIFTKSQYLHINHLSDCKYFYCLIGEEILALCQITEVLHFTELVRCCHPYSGTTHTCAHFWALQYRGDVDKLERVQQKATKVMSGPGHLSMRKI